MPIDPLVAFQFTTINPANFIHIHPGTVPTAREYFPLIAQMSDYAVETDDTTFAGELIGALNMLDRLKAELLDVKEQNSTLEGLLADLEARNAELS